MYSYLWVVLVEELPHHPNTAVFSLPSIPLLVIAKLVPSFGITPSTTEVVLFVAEFFFYFIYTANTTSLDEDGLPQKHIFVGL